MKQFFTSLAIVTLPLTFAQTTTAPASTPSNGGACSGDTAFCAGGPIILRCDSGKLQAGNCDDNLNEPPLGATCVSYAPSSASCSAFGTSTTTTTTSVPTPGGSCEGADSYCVGGPIILRCGADGTLGPGNCDDNLGEPPFGATCVQYAPTAASCSALPGPTSTTTESSTPIPTSCTKDQSYCAGVDTPIILRCRENGTLYPGNCADNLGEPPYGALCVQYASAAASCSALSGPTGTGTGTGGSGPTASASNGTFPGSATLTPTAPVPISTGAADTAHSWTGVVMAGFAAAVAGGAMAL